MAVSIRVYPNLSPRLIEVLAPTTDVSVQELVNEIRAWEDSTEGIDFPALIDAAGKEALGGGVTVGITATLLNARILFTGRTTALDYGTGRTCDLSDPKGETLYVDDADFINDGVYEGCTVFNATTGGMASVISVDDANTLTHLALTGGSSDEWTIGDEYIVYPNVQCNIAGGNLVATDINGDELSSVFQTPNVQVVRSSSSSATLQELGAIQFSSYNGGVWISNSGVPGTAYPIGTPEAPVNNLEDAHEIAENNGFTNFNFLENWTFVSTNILNDGYNFIGRGLQKSLFTFEAGSTFPNSSVKNATVIGESDGIIGFDNCRIDDFYANNTSDNDILINYSLLKGIFKVAPTYTGTVVVVDSAALPELTAPPIFDFNDANCSLQMRNFSGFVNLKNSTDDNDIRIFLTSGGVELDSSCTDGSVIITGVGTLVDNSGVDMSVETGALINKVIIAEAVWDEEIASHLTANTFGHAMYHQEYNKQVAIDTVNGTAGTGFPIGTHENPVNNLADALTIASTHGFQILHIDGSLTIDGEDITGYTLLSERSLGNSVIITSMTNTDACYFQDLYVTGNLTGATRFTTCVLGTLTGFDGGAKNCLLTSSIEIVGSGSNYFTDCDTYITDHTQFKVLDVGDNFLNLIRCRGNYQLTNKIGANTTAIDLVAGTVKVDNTCTTGTVFMDGIVKTVDESAAGCDVIISNSVNPEVIASFNWDELLNNHTIPGSAGDSLANVSSGADPTQIAEAVWDEPLADHQTSGTVGAALIDIGLDVKRVLGLTQENFRIKNQVYDANNCLTSANINIYNNATDCDNDVNPLAQYQMTASYNASGHLIDYKVLKS